MDESKFFEDEIPKGGVTWIYDNDIADFVEDIQKALVQIGVTVRATLVASNRERSDFLFYKVE
jgi:hypothetical protein